MHGTRTSKAQRRQSGELRESILRLLQRAHRPLTGLELTERLGRHREPPFQSQVFRALGELCRRGAIRRIATTNGYAVGGDTRRINLICSRCGKLETVRAEKLFSALDQLALSERFVLRCYLVEVSGICAGCDGEDVAADR